MEELLTFVSTITPSDIVHELRMLSYYLGFFIFFLMINVAWCGKGFLHVSKSRSKRQKKGEVTGPTNEKESVAQCSHH